MRVFILQFSNKYDVSAAKAHGDIVYLIDEQLNPFYPNKVIKSIRCRLKKLEFNPGKDAVVLTGSSNLIALFLATVIFDYSSIMTLVYEHKTQKYILRTIDMRLS